VDFYPLRFGHNYVCIKRRGDNCTEKEPMTDFGKKILKCCVAVTGLIFIAAILLAMRLPIQNPTSVLDHILAEHEKMTQIGFFVSGTVTISLIFTLAMASRPSKAWQRYPKRLRH